MRRTSIAMFSPEHEQQKQQQGLRTAVPRRQGISWRPAGILPNAVTRDVLEAHSVVQTPDVSMCRDDTTTVDGAYITARDAKLLCNNRREPQNKAFHALMDMIQKRIRTALTFGHSDLLWTVPSHHVDIPIYDQRQMTKRVKKKLIQNGFYVRRVVEVDVGCLYVSWRYQHEKTTV